jgi:hypothetical protein
MTTIAVGASQFLVDSKYGLTAGVTEPLVLEKNQAVYRAANSGVFQHFVCEHAPQVPWFSFVFFIPREGVFTRSLVIHSRTCES